MQKTISLLVIVLAVVSILTAAGCRNSLDVSGIWHSEVEYVPGQMVAIDFELQKGFFDSEWSGRFEMMEALDYGELSRITVSDSTVDIHFQNGLKFTGVVSADGNSLRGTLHAPSTEILQTYTKVDDWTTNAPARADEQGQRIVSWDYHIPEIVDDGWAVGSLDDVGFRQTPLQDLFQKVLAGQYEGLDALLISKDGKLVLEEYFYFGSRDEIHTIQSATKSVTSLVFGMAWDEGMIPDLDQPVYKYFPGYADSAWVKDEYPISLRHVLMMSAPLDWRETGTPYTDPRNDAIRMNRSGDMYGYILSRNRQDGENPGDEFEYTSGLSILFGGVLLEATGVPIDVYAEQTLFKKMGIDSLYWSTSSGQVHTGGGLRMRARDLLKLGQLVLDKGKWNGQQIISESWMEESTAFQLPRNGSARGGGYGYQWWREVFNVEHQQFPAIYASGYGAQMMWIIPDLDLVVLAFHHNPKEGAASYSILEDEIESYILPSVLPN